MVKTLPQTYTISGSDKETVSINYTDWLDGSELLTGTPTVTESTTTVFTLSNKQVNTATYIENNGDTVAIGKAVQFQLVATSTPAAAATYTFVITVSTDAANPRTVERAITLEVV